MLGLFFHNDKGLTLSLCTVNLLVKNGTDNHLKFSVKLERLGRFKTERR
jgi:hypothetical protein